MLAYDSELFGKADEMDLVAVRLDPSRTSMGMPALLPSGSLGDVQTGSEQILDCITHGGAL